MTRLLSLLALALPTPLAAQAATCTDHATMVQRLAEGWRESRQAIGLGADNAVVEVYASAETGTWTVLVTRPGGPTCLVASGDAFEIVAEGPPDLGEGA